MNNASPPPPLSVLLKEKHRWALFLDFDGTLVDLAASPDAIEVPAALPTLLRRLERRLSGALAILTGRSLGDLDRRLAGLAPAAAGQHGAEFRRRPGGPAVRARARAFAAIRPQVREFAARLAGVRVEDKGAGIALHYRAEPSSGAAVKHQVAVWAAASAGALESLDGKCVCELRPAGVSKGRAVREFMREQPFRGCRPLVLGDDVTDEAAFEASHALGGAAIKVGSGESRAEWRLNDSRAVRGWLARGGS